MRQSGAALAEERAPRGKVHNIDKAINKRKARKKRASFLRTVILIVFFCGGALSLLARNVSVTEQGRKVSDLKAEYSALYSQNKKTEVAINKKIDLKTVEEVAVSVYGMNRARKEQKIPIFIDSRDYGVIAKNNDSHHQETKKINALAGLLAYFE